MTHSAFAEPAGAKSSRCRIALWFALPLLLSLPCRSAEVSTPEAERYRELPLSFEANQGQFDAKVKFFCRSSGYGLFLTPEGAVLVLSGSASQPARLGSNTVRMKLLGAKQNPVIEGIEPASGKANYFLGSVPGTWRTGISLYQRVVYRQVYPGIDTIFYGRQGNLEFDFRLSPGADPRKIRLAYSGVRRMRIDASGDLVLSTAAGEVRQHKPRLYQAGGGSLREISGGYRWYGKNVVGFDVPRYDREQELLIDPVVTYASYLGGSRLDVPKRVRVDGSGNVYVAGTTESVNFKTTAGALSTVNSGGCDAFVSKFAPGGSLVYSTYIGGSECEEAAGLAVDSGGNAYITGTTESTNFPIVNAVQPSNPGGLNARLDAFVAKLNPQGNQLVYSTYLGGTLEDGATGIAVDAQGNAFVTGMTVSDNFPTTALAYQPMKPGLASGFVTKLDASGQSILYSTFIGGSELEAATSVTVDASGHAYAAGLRWSSDFPTTAGALRSQNLGEADIFAVKLNPEGSTAVWSLLLGGSADDIVVDQVVDASGNVYLAGATDSSDFPVTPNAAQKQNGGGTDAFLAKINSAGTALLYSTYLGGSSYEGAFSVAFGSEGNVYLAGQTDSSNFPTAAPFQAAAYMSYACFVAKVDTVSGALGQATYLGGRYGDGCYGASSASDEVYVTGPSMSLGIPTSQNAAQAGYAGLGDAFLVRLDFSAGASSLTFTPVKLDFRGVLNAPVPAQSVVLSFSSGTSIAWKIGGTGSGLTVSPQSGMGSGTVDVTVTTAGLKAGSTYRRTMTVVNETTGALMAAIPISLEVLVTISSVSAASFEPGAALAPESITSAFGEGLSASTYSASSVPLPTALGGISVIVRDSAGTARPAPLFFVSSGQINYLIPAGTSLGPATVTVNGTLRTVAMGTLQIDSVSPGLFTANADGRGAPAGVAVRYAADGAVSWDYLFQCGTGIGSCIPKLIDPGSAADTVYLQLYGTGIRGASSLSAATAKIGGVDAPVEYAGPAPGFVGLDQINIRLPRSLSGRGEADVVLTVDGKAANTVKVSVK